MAAEPIYPADRPGINRRRALLLLATTAAVGLLDACGAASSTAPAASGASTASAVSSSAATSSVAAAAVAPTPTIPAGLAPATYGGSGGPHLQVWWPNGSKDLVLDASAQAFLKTHPTWSIEISYTNGVDKFLTAEAAGTPPDAFLTTTDRMLQLAAKTTLLPLDGYLATDKVDMTQYFKAAVLGLTYKNKTYGMPEHLDVGSVYQNDRLLQEVGLDPAKGPQSWDDLATINQHVMQKSGQDLQRAGFIPTWGWPVDTVGWLQANGVPMLSADGTKVAFNTAAGAEAMNWVLTQLNALGGVGAIAAYEKPFKNATRDALAQDRLGVAMMGVWSLANMLTDTPQVVMSQWPMPGGPAIAGQTLGYFVAELIMLPAGSKQPDNAWQYVKWHSGPGGQQFVQTVPGAWDLATIPAVANDPASIQAQPWRQRANVLMASAQTPGVILSPAGDDMAAAMNKVAADLWSGKQDVSTSMTQMAQQAQAVLDQYLKP